MKLEIIFILYLRPGTFRFLITAISALFPEFRKILRLEIIANKHLNQGDQQKLYWKFIISLRAA